MPKRSLTGFIIFALLLQICGCTSVWVIPPSEEYGEIQGRVTATMVNGEKVQSIHSGTTIVVSDTLYIETNNGEMRIPLSEVRTLSGTQFEIKQTAMLAGISAVFLGLVLIAETWY